MEVFGPGAGTFRPLGQRVVRHAPDERRGDGRRPTGIWQFWGARGAEHPPDSEEDERGLPRRKAATTIDTATAEEDGLPSKVFPRKNSDGV